jgi:hypothetical protein
MYYPKKDTCYAGGDKKITRRSYEYYLKKLKRTILLNNILFIQLNINMEIKLIKDKDKIIELFFFLALSL